MPSRASSLAALLTAAATAATSLVASVATATPAGAAADPEPTPDGVTLVQANIKSALSTTRFRADVATVLADRPDFVTYNEVPERLDEVLAPEGYAVHRLMRNRYTKANAVAWRTDRWTAVETGTFRISNHREVPKGKKVKLGLRFANWVTLQSADGRQLSVVATHLPPLTKGMPDLLRPSMKRVGKLAEQLAPRGPVLLGGDFNVHYRSGRFPRDLVDAARVVPTYDTLGTWFPTGDHRGATIDYVFNRGAELLEAGAHHPVELYSDHDAVVADLAWTTDAPGTSERVVSDPASEDSRRLAVGAVLDAVRSAEPGEQLVVVTSDLSLGAVMRQLKRAVRRGAHLTLLTRSETLTRAERRLARVVHRSGDDRSEVTGCHDACLDRWRDSGMAATFLILRDQAGAARLRVDASRPLSPAMLQRRTQAVTHTGSVALAEGEDQLAAVR